MAIDLAALKREAEGEGTAIVPVTKRWLAEVHRTLTEAQRANRNDKILSAIGGSLTA